MCRRIKLRKTLHRPMPMKQPERSSWAYIKRSTEGRFQANLKIEMEDMQMSQSTELHFTSFPTVFALGVPRHHPTRQV